jgi:1-acyl-sn-glycerol-3-phosphate acyltransferase
VERTIRVSYADASVVSTDSARGAITRPIDAGPRPRGNLPRRPRITGAEHIPLEGPAISAPNHKSFPDALFIAIATRRPVRHTTKTELFKGPLGWLFVGLGAFPVRRGAADAEALRTVRQILEHGGLLVIFPRGPASGSAIRSARQITAGRLALDTGALIPAATAGTERLWLGPFAKPHRVQLSLLLAIDPAELTGEPDPVTRLVDELVWPAVRREYGDQLARPGVILTALSAIGLGARLAALRRTTANTRLLSIVAPGNVRRRQARQRRRQRLRRLIR